MTQIDIISNKTSESAEITHILFDSLYYFKYV